MSRAFVAEALGTAILVSVVIGSAIMARDLGAAGAELLLANALATVGALWALISILGPVSGAHFNPLVSLVMALRGDLGWRWLAPFILAQALGALAGVALAHGMFGLPVWQVATVDRSGSAKVLAEAVASFGLIFVILGGQAARANGAGLVAGWIGAAYWFTSSTSFANPAMLLARALTDTPSGIRPGDTPGFLVAEVLGGLLALALGGWLFAGQRD